MELLAEALELGQVVAQPELAGQQRQEPLLDPGQRRIVGDGVVGEVESGLDKGFLTGDLAGHVGRKAAAIGCLKRFAQLGGVVDCGFF